MPSHRHEALVDLLRQEPGLCTWLAARTLGLRPPRRGSARVDEAGFSQLVPPERRADLILRLARGAPWAGLIVEVQLSRRARKRLLWPLYAAALRVRLRGPVCLVVVAPDARVAAWASAPITGGQPASQFVPLVLGPAVIPWLANPHEAALRPGLAALAAITHGSEPGGERIALAALRAARRLDADRAARYADIVVAALAEAARRRLEALMESSGYPYSDWARKHYFEGMAKGEAKGEAKGKAEGKAAAILAVLAARGVRVSAPERARFIACTEARRLDAWIVAAATATSAGEVLRATPARRRRNRPARSIVCRTRRARHRAPRRAP
ncbi:MAG: hypothetical protein HY906_22415 [Deltaproteobacteria bacterium]|nr:hypothetical protein [Deltaproteobacteria bacterium]